MKHFVVGLSVLFALACGSGPTPNVPKDPGSTPEPAPAAAQAAPDDDEDDAGGAAAGTKVCCKDVNFSKYFPYGRKLPGACPGEEVDASFCVHVCCSMPVQNEDGTSSTIYKRIPTGNCASNEFETRAIVDDGQCGERKKKGG